MFLRMESSGIYGGKQQYDAIAEAVADLPTGSGKASFNGSQVDLAPGSMVYVMEDDAVHIRKSDNTWN